MLICGMCKRAWKHMQWWIVSLILFAFVGGFIVAWGLRDYQDHVWRQTVRAEFVQAVTYIGRMYDTRTKKGKWKDATKKRSVRR